MNSFSGEVKILADFCFILLILQAVGVKEELLYTLISINVVG